MRVCTLLRRAVLLYVNSSTLTTPCTVLPEPANAVEGSLTRPSAPASVSSIPVTPPWPQHQLSTKPIPSRTSRSLGARSHTRKEMTIFPSTSSPAIKVKTLALCASCVGTASRLRYSKTGDPVDAVSRALLKTNKIIRAPFSFPKPDWKSRTKKHNEVIGACDTTPIR